MLQVSGGTPRQIYPVADSRPGRRAASPTSRRWRTRARAVAPVATSTEQTGRRAPGVRRRPADPRQAASRGVAVFADTLSDVQDNVALIRRRILVAGGVALVLAALAGYLVARG